MWFAEPGTAPEADARAVAVADIAHRGIDELSGLRARGTRAKLYAFRGDAVHRCPATMPPTAPGRWSTD
ncbi:hypothetical protein P6B95_06540 [Streptomyces atratus]|uniref:hypothetical protein n=1 Tax=Streptomyces atratus TaxID=1893 RepID=UPI00167029AE|nr:hypothetical protein [Streptomyces atratus]WPW27090.1 hypothetical protein P6B95_06540 [Streptomyces atratus]